VRACVGISDTYKQQAVKGHVWWQAHEQQTPNGLSLGWLLQSRIGAVCAGADAASPSEDSEDAEISWDIDITEAAEEAENVSLDTDASQSAPLGMQAESNAHEHAWPESVLRLSEDSSFRTAFLDDLYELSSFLLQQIQELKSGEPV